MINGNTFDTKTISFGHSSKVWREIRHRYPAGGTIQNVSDWVSAGKIPAGTPIKYDAENKEIVAYTDEQVKTAENITTLGINSYLQDDAFIRDGNTIATGTAIYAGELYDYMFEAEVLSKLRGITTVPGIVWVH